MTVNGGGTTATLTFTGTATAHADANDVSNLTITFLDGAFTNTSTASNVTGYTNTTGTIDFDDPAIEEEEEEPAVTPTVTNTQSGGSYSTTGGVTGAVHQAAEIRSKNDYQPIKKDGSVISSSPTIPTIQFTDIKGHWSESYVQKLGQSNIVIGKTSETFDPDGNITRAEITKIIVEAFDIPMVEYPDRPFPDVSIAKWYTYYIQSALVAKIIDGYVDGFFYPENNVTRAEAVKMLLEAVDIKIDNQEFLLTYKDVKRAHWFVDYIYTAKSLGLITGYDDDTFRPNEYITRGEIAKITSVILDYLQVMTR